MRAVTSHPASACTRGAAESRLIVRFEGDRLVDGETGAEIAYRDPDGVWRAPDGTPCVGLELPIARLTAAVTDAARAARNREIDAAWQKAALEQVRQLALTRPTLTTDDVWEVLEMPPREGRQLGALMAACRSSGLIEPTPEQVPSQRPNCHRRPVRVWRSLVYGALTLDGLG